MVEGDDESADRIEDVLLVEGQQRNAVRNVLQQRYRLQVHDRPAAHPHADMGLEARLAGLKIVGGGENVGADDPAGAGEHRMGVGNDTADAVGGAVDRRSVALAIEAALHVGAADGEAVNGNHVSGGECGAVGGERRRAPGERRKEEQSPDQQAAAPGGGRERCRRVHRPNCRHWPALPALRPCLWLTEG